MKLSIKLAAFIFIFDILVDLVLSIIFSIWADREIWADFLKNRTSEEKSPKTEFWPQFLHDYNFFASQIDFIFCSLLRLCVLSGAFLGIVSNRIDGPKKLATTARGMFLGFMSVAIFSLIKLLALDEIRSDFRIPFFWLNFSFNILFSVSAFCCWYFVLSNVLPGSRDLIESSTSPPTSNNVHVIANGQVGSCDDHNFSDTAHLIDENGAFEAAPDPESVSETSKKDDKKKDKVSLKETRHLLLRLARYCYKDWPWYLLGFFFLLLYSGARMLIPLFTSNTLNFITDRSYHSLTGGILQLLALCVASAIFSGLRGGAFTYASSRMILRIRSQLFLSLTKQEIGFFDMTKTGDITSRLTSDCQTLTDSFSLNVNCFLRNLIMFFGSLVVMLNLSWNLTLIMLIMIPIATFVTHLFGHIFQNLSTKMQDNLAKANEVADEVLGSMKTVRSFANEIEESKRYDDLLYTTLKILIKRCLFYISYNGFGELFGPLTLVIMLWYGGHLVLTNRMQPNVLVAFILYQTLLGETIYVMGLAYNGLMEAAGASKKVFELIDRVPKIPNDGILAPDSLSGRVEFKKVNFVYPSRPSITVLKDVSFSVEPGEIVALVGPSGGGKSSCIALLEHFYEPLSGEILLDGIPINCFNHKYYHRQVALVGQEPVLYAKSIAENIAYALNSNEFTKDDIIRVSRLANAHQFIVSLNKAYDTYVGEKGAQLSGGQKQRVAIARAVIRKPKVLLLDEATSALDSESEHLVQQALYENLAGYTILLIAHRLSTVQRADRIIVIDSGQVVQQGKHEELLKIDGLYKNLVQKQLLGDVKQDTKTDDNG